jgi:hypothetical protein
MNGSTAQATPRNGSAVKADTEDEWAWTKEEHSTEEPQRRRDQATTKNQQEMEWQIERIQERKNRLVEAAGTRTMTTMKKPNEANKQTKHNLEQKTTINLTTMVATYLVAGDSRWVRRRTLQIHHHRFSKLRKLSETEKWVLEKVSALETKKLLYVEDGASLKLPMSKKWEPCFLFKIADVT